MLSMSVYQHGLWYVNVRYVCLSLSHELGLFYMCIDIYVCKLYIAHHFDALTSLCHHL